MKKKIILTFVIIIILGGILYCSVLCFKKMNDINTETDLEGKEITKEEYLYKEELLSLTYTVNEIDIIENKISNVDVKNYLLAKKYSNLINFIDSPYFKTEHIERYQNYLDNYDDIIPTDTVVMHVEIGLDNKFYTNIQEADITKGVLILVNKYNKLNKDYDANLIDIDKKYGSGKMNVNAYDSFVKMCEEAKENNINLKSVSAYRSYTRQETLYKQYSKKSNADTYSARAGHSEHQTGLAVDINVSQSSKHFEKTKEYKWLINNAYKYGFILRYPENKTNITGYIFEPWHYRYVGKDAAIKIYEEQITFEEYLVKYAM